jgi:hypothetical protein
MSVGPATVSRVPGRSSLETILDEARSERAIQLRHFDALDARAGVILGFAGVLVALFPSGGPLIDLGRLAAVASGLLALWTFSQRPETGVDLSPLIEQYSSADPDFTVRRLIRAHVDLTEILRRLVRVKIARLRASMTALAAGAVLSSLGLVVN